MKSRGWGLGGRRFGCGSWLCKEEKGWRCRVWGRVLRGKVQGDERLPSGSAPWRGSAGRRDWTAGVAEHRDREVVGPWRCERVRGDSHVLLLCSITGSHASLGYGTVVS